MNKTYNWYQTLVKPAWAPPNWVFGPIWTVLYIIILGSFGWVFLQVFKGKIPMIVALPFILNLVFNFAFTPIQFGLKNNFLASVDIILVLTTIVWMMTAIWRYSRPIVYLNLPYLIWVSIATVLQLSITYLNWGK